MCLLRMQKEVNMNAIGPNAFGVIKGPKSAPIYPQGLGFSFQNLETFRHGHPADIYAQLQRDAPVYWHEEAEDWEPGFWVITKYEDVAAISKNPTLFSSQVGGHQISYGDPRKMDPAIKAAVTGNMIGMDPPLHNVYRRMVSGAFTPKALKELQPNIDRRVDMLLDAIDHDGEVNFAQTVSEQLPIFTLCDLLGVPEADRGKLIDWTNKLTAAYDPDSAARYGMDPETLTNMAGMELFQYGAWLFAEKKKCPAHDLMSVVANATPEGGEIPQMHLDGFFMLMVVAGNETTRNTISGMIPLLDRHPEQRAALFDDVRLLPGAVDEALRLVSPVIHFRRTATADTDMRGQSIKAGEKVVIWYGAANRDPAIFAHPHQFDIRRSNAGKHLSFGIGEHFCLGSVMGKMQIESLFARLIARFPKLRMTAQPHYVGSNFISGIDRLMVRAQG
jgi:cytochrome P450